MSTTEDDLRDFTAFVKERLSRSVGQEKGTGALIGNDPRPLFLLGWSATVCPLSLPAARPSYGIESGIVRTREGRCLSLTDQPLRERSFHSSTPPRQGTRDGTHEAVVVLARL